jgi:hypothetical protein
MESWGTELGRERPLLFRRDSLRPGGPFLTAAERWPFAPFFAGVGLTAFGSAYYHLEPTNDRLLWDRLPMTVAFMGLFAAVLSERVRLRARGPAG